MGKIRIGERAPSFSLKETSGKIFHFKKILGTQPVVLFFYPKDGTWICTAEACSFRDHYEDFLEAGAVVIGISADPPQSHKQFAHRHQLPFTLLSDPEGKVRDLYGIQSTWGLIPGRVTFVIDQEGTIRHIFDSPFSAHPHVQQALKILKTL